MTVVQLILLFLIGFTGTRVLLRLKEGKLAAGAFLFWIVVWGGAFVVVLFPTFTTKAAQILGVGRGADAVTYLSIVVLFYLVFRTNVELENVRHEITELVRQIALSRTAKRRPNFRLKR
ncbi:hypothetical protein A3A66_00645 [Microgenomates group bacterium RIFCSPLOWO2_01_FULL_46_13]|nr:MAG: hypothetical protein A2783_02715 [Microgenomates group bacterium RIFCSPHIGHO2_01_FULL_45_11]OGV94519.1 MAG: hypothetical protein A3A66_00645 [Microgenomates group bacterium RIFCSPLOWO2_01_FULL_46_13]